jgi:hypothetical protein
MSRRDWLAAAASTGVTQPCYLRAQESAPPFPLSALTDSAVWDRSVFRDAFLPQVSPTRLVHKYWPAEVTLFGFKPHGVVARCRDDTIESLTLLFLDSGTHFGYVPRVQAKQTEMANKEEFRALFQSVVTVVRGGFEKLADGQSGTPLMLGTEPMISQQSTLYRCGNAIARLHHMDEQLVKVVLFRDEVAARHWFDPVELARKPRDRESTYARGVSSLGNGDTLLSEVPVLPQGDRAYCGVSALAMAMQSLGLWIDTEDYAASAGIRYGSTQGSHIREVYEAAAAEAGFRLSRATRYDHEKVIASIDAGLPAIVWRRWTPDRDFLHTTFLKKLTADPEVRLPEPDAADRETWPAKAAYNHASVITGYNTERKEVIFSESWSETVRNRRMRPEEMEATAYYTFLLRL